MSNEAIILTLLSIIGVLICAGIGYFMKSNELTTNAIRDDIKELTDMFRRHVRNSKIHVNMTQMED